VDQERKQILERLNVSSHGRHLNETYTDIPRHHTPVARYGNLRQIIFPQCDVGSGFFEPDDLENLALAVLTHLVSASVLEFRFKSPSGNFIRNLMSRNVAMNFLKPGHLEN
jgi:hypothetical protein